MKETVACTALGKRLCSWHVAVAISVNPGLHILRIEKLQTVVQDY
jgi:hypothetical protein